MIVKRTKNKKGKVSRKSKFFRYGALLVAVALVAAGVYLVFIRQNEPSQEEIDTAQIESSKDKIVKESSGKDKTKDKTKNLPTNSETKTVQDIPVSQSFTVSIDEAAQRDRQVFAKASISGASKDGTCVFSFTKDGDRPIVRQVASKNNSCSVAIPEVEFAMLGQWKLNVVFYIDDVRAEANTNVEIN